MFRVFSPHSHRRRFPPLAVSYTHLDVYKRQPPDSRWFQIREPLCQGSLGLSTHESWPPEAAESHNPPQRIYLFADHGWHADLPTLTNRNLP